MIIFKYFLILRGRFRRRDNYNILQFQEVIFLISLIWEGGILLVQMCFLISFYRLFIMVGIYVERFLGVLSICSGQLVLLRQFYIVLICSIVLRSRLLRGVVEFFQVYIFEQRFLSKDRVFLLFSFKGWQGFFQIFFGVLLGVYRFSFKSYRTFFFIYGYFFLLFEDFFFEFFFKQYIQEIIYLVRY